MEIRSVSANAALRVTLIVFGVLIALRFLWIAHAIFIITFLGVLLGLAVAKAVDRLERAHIRRGMGAALVIATLVAGLSTVFIFIGPSIREQSGELGRELPKALEEVDKWFNRTPVKTLIPTTPQTPPHQRGLTAQLARELRGSTKFLFPIVSTVFGAAGGLVIILFIAMYIAASPGLYREGILHLIPHRLRDRGEEWLDTLGTTLRQWLIARLMAMVIIGVVTGAALWLMDVKAAVALGVLAGLLEFVPFFGPVASAIPAVGVALVDSPHKAAWVVGLYVVVQQLEGNVVTPLLLEKRLDIPPVLTVVAVAAMGVVFGIIGMLIAEPLLAVVLVTTKMLYVNDAIGDDVKVGKES